MISTWINNSSDLLWNIFLPLLITLGFYINARMLMLREQLAPADNTRWQFKKIKSALSISLGSKVGTGAVIGMLAAMWLSSDEGTGGEGIVLWIFIGMLLMVPVTYSEVLFTQVTKSNPRDFIARYLSPKLATLYAIGLVILYTFGFVGFQFTGVQTVVRLVSERAFDYQFSETGALFAIILPILLGISTIVLSKSHELFVNTLSSMILSLIAAYTLFFLIFVYMTNDFLPHYFQLIYQDFIQLRSASLGLPIGLIIGFQRIIQISETSLGTGALCSSGRENSPRREAAIQSMATIISILVAVVITSYIFSYGRYHFDGIELTGNGFERIKGFILTAYNVTGYYGMAVVIAFFIVSGFTTILGSFHYVKTSLRLSVNGSIAVYLSLISVSGFLSVANFGVIFDATNLLMFSAGVLNLLAMAQYVRPKNLNQTCPNFI